MDTSQKVLAEMDLGESVRLARERRGWGQNDLAKRAELNQSTLQRIESGRSADPGVSLVLKIARALGITVEDLVGRQKGEAPKPLTSLDDRRRLDALEKKVDRLLSRLERPQGGR